MTIYHYDKKLKKVVEGPPPPRETFSKAPFFIMPMFQEYQAVGVDNRIVKSRSEHKNMLKEHGLEEVGNEKPEWMKERQREREERGTDV